ncbi:MAG TPA: ParB/RepB/Spo0J family partition protein [Gemmataceae bacterium]|jgi:hypothetical protein
MNPKERQNLKDSIRQVGVLTLIIVDENDGIIDGINRASIVAELGHPHIPSELRNGLTLDQKRELAEWYNVSRRHLTPAEQAAVLKARRARVVQKRKEGQSLRSIAEEVGVDVAQVHRDLKESPVAAATPAVPPPITGSAIGVPITPPAPPLTIIGRDGKKYAATNRKRKKKYTRTRPLPAPPRIDSARLEEFRTLWATFTDEEKRFYRSWVLSH